MHISVFRFLVTDFQAHDADEADNMVYEATFKETTLDGSTIYEGIGYTFDDVMEYCVEC